MGAKEMWNNRLFVDIGSAYIKILYGRKGLRKIIINSFGMLTTPENSFDNGYITDTNSIAKQINIFLKDKKIKTNNISYAIHSSDIISRKLEIPRLGRRAVKETIEYEMDQYIKNTIKNYDLSYEILEKKDKQYRLLAVIVPKHLINQYGLLSDVLKMRIKYIDVATKCVLRFFKPIASEFIVMDFGNESTRISLYANRELFAERELIFKRGTKDKTYLMNNAQIIEDKETKLDSVFKHFNQIIEYYHINGNSSIDKIFIIGGDSESKELREYISNNFGLSKNFFNSMNVVSRNYDIEFRKSMVFYINTLGILLRK
jgi:Tfp pilus assembly PilM family ATPase